MKLAKKITTAAALAAALLAGTVPPGQFCRLPEGSDSPPNGSEKQV